jgi:hypothetical protein
VVGVERGRMKQKSTPTDLCNELLTQCDKDGKVAVPVTLRLYPSELARIATEAQGAGVTVEDHIAENSIRHWL